MTPDHHPVMGPVRDLPGFFLANGFSGHGVMHSPATGRILADLILHGNTDLVDAERLNYDRFASGRLLHEPVVL
jgi:sarcosine oxidase subunit beta